MLSPNGSTEVLTGRMQPLASNASVYRFLLFMLVRLTYVALAIYFGPFVTYEAIEFGQAIREFQILKGVI